MAGDWIKMCHDLDTAPEVISVAGQLDTSRSFVVGCVYKLWCWADVHTEDGGLSGVTLEFINQYLGVTGIADALVDVGWLESTPEGIVIPKFDRHNGKSAKQRANTARRVEKSRTKEPAGELLPSERYKSVTDVTQPALQNRYKCNAASVTESLPEKSRVEKRRDIIITDEEKSFSGSSATVDTTRAFLVLWDIWPAHRRMNKRQAEAAWDKAINREPPETILAAGKAFAKSPKGMSEFCTSLSKWLEHDGWADDPASWQQGKQPPKKTDPAEDASRVLYREFSELRRTLADMTVDSTPWTTAKARIEEIREILDT